MDVNGIEMGEWYHHGGYGTTEYTPLSLHCDSFTEMAFRERKSGEIFLFSVYEMEPVPEPVVFVEQWIVMGKRGAADAWDSLEGAEAGVQYRADSGYRTPAIGILHVRPDGSTEMLEIKS